MSPRAKPGVWTAILLALLILALIAPAALAQDYRFRLIENRSDWIINEDGTVRIIYDLTVSADPGSDPLDVFDVGLPNDSYRNVTASIDGVPLSVTNSPYVDHGVAVDLGGRAIQPGQTGTLHIEATVDDLIYQDSKDAEYASMEFAPTWFDGDFVHGTTRQEVNLHFPPAVTTEEPRYHDREFTSARVEDGRVVYTWIDESTTGSQRVVYGASFPKRNVPVAAVQKPPAFNINFGGLCSSPFVWILGAAGAWGVLAWLGSLTQKRRKMEYLPPALGVEGTGIKRGLTAVEAAVLLEAPLNKVLTMILFSLIKKGRLVVESEKPLKVQPVTAPQESAPLRDYEQRFLAAIKPDGTMKEGELREMTIDLIGDVNKKLAGFSRKDTVTYYKDIAARAWQQVETADTPEVLGTRFGDGLEWAMLDEDWDDRTRQVFHDRPVVLPSWWWAYRPWVARAGTPGPSIPSTAGGGQPVTLPTLPGADFANTVVTGVENAANTVVSSVENFAGQVTQKTNPPPPPSRSGSSRGGGGYSCACACACAGCACACAGGGR